MLNRGEILEIIEEELAKVHAEKVWTQGHYGQATALQRVLDTIKKREEE